MKLPFLIPATTLAFVVTLTSMSSCSKRIVESVEVAISDSTVISEVNVLDFETTAGSDHEMIQLAIDYAYNNGIAGVYIPAGTYEIDAAGVNGDRGIGLKDGITLRLDSAAVLKAIPNNAGTYSVVRIQNVNNAKLIGGTILGERNEHLGTTGEWGMGIDIRNADSITVQDVLIKYCWGDGIYVGGSSPNRNILIENTTCDSNRRQGISVVHADGLIVKNSTLSNTNGTPPQAGIDLEPNSSQTVKNVLVIGTLFFKNKGAGFLAYAASGEVSDVRVENCTADSNYHVALQLNGGPIATGNERLQRVSFSDVTVSNTVQLGVYVRNSSNVSFDSTRVLETGHRAFWSLNSAHVSLDSFMVKNAKRGGILITESDSINANLCVIDVGYPVVSGIALENSNDLSFSSISVYGGGRGVDSKNVTNLGIENSIFSSQGNYGLYLDSTYHSVLETSQFEDINQVPIYIHNSVSNDFVGNTFVGNCHESNDSYSVFKLSGTSNGNTVANNTIQLGSSTNKAKYGIWLMTDTYSNSLSTNTIANDSYVVSEVFDEGTDNDID